MDLYSRDCRFRGNDTLHLANLSIDRPLNGQRRGELLHSAKMFRISLVFL